MPEEGTLTRLQIRDRAEHPEQYADELIFDDYLGAVQRCLVFRGSYGFCCVIRDVSDAGRFYGVFLFDQDGRLTETPEGRAVAMPEGEALEAKVLGRPLDAAVAEYGEPLFDAGSGLYIPAWFTEDGRVVYLRGVDDVSDPVAKIETRYVLTEGSLPVQTQRLTDEQLGEIFNKAVEDGDLDALVREYQGVVIRQTEYFNSAADRTALFYGKTKLLLVSEEQTKAGKTKLSRYLLPLSASAATFDGLRPGAKLEDVRRLDPDGGVFSFLVLPAQTDSRSSSHYTEDGWLLRVQYESDSETRPGEHGGLPVQSVARTHLAFVYTDYSIDDPPAPGNDSGPTQTVRRTDEELWTILEKVEEEKPPYETVIGRYQPAHLDGTQAAEVLGYAENGEDDPMRICFLYGETRQLIIAWNNPNEKDAGPVCSSGPLSPPKMAFDSVREGTSLDTVREMDPNAIYPLEHLGGRVQQYSTHFTEDGWVIRVDYDETQTGFTVKAVTRTHVALVYNDAQEPAETGDVPALTEGKFRQLEADRFLSPWGEEYVFLCNEGFLYAAGKSFIFVGGIEGEPDTYTEYGQEYKNGFFAVEGSKTGSILIRQTPYSEWAAIYRKASAPPFDYSVDCCVRLELLPWMDMSEEHLLCGDGITDRAEIAAFLADVRAQKSPKEAGLYDLVRNEHGTLENCYACGYIYGSFLEEPNLVLMMKVTSYNDLAYSVSLGTQTNGWPAEYVLPEEWIPRLLPPGETFPTR